MSSSVGSEARTTRLKKIFQLSKDVIVRFPHQFLLVVRWPIEEVKGFCILLRIDMFGF